MNVIFSHYEKDHSVSLWVENIKNVLGEKILVYDFNHQKNLSYLNKEKSSKIYEGVLDFCQENKIKHLIIPYLHYPEFLLSELDCRKDLNTKISFASNERLISASKATINTYINLLNKKQVFRMLVVYSITTFPKKLFEFGKTIDPKSIKKLEKSKKIKKICEPCLEKAEIMDSALAKSKLGFKKEDFVILFFGSIFYGKGLDILLDAYNLIRKKDTKLLISTLSKFLNFDLDLKKFNKKDIKFIDKFVNREEKDVIFNASDVVVLPYRASYLNNPSGVLLTAIQYKKLLITPNFYPFNKAVEEYKIGVTSLDAETMISNPEAYCKKIAEKITYIKESFGNVYKEALFDKFLEKIISYKEFANYFLE